MHFRIADTFTQSLAKLTNEEQTTAKNAAFDLQLNSAHPGLQLHRLDRVKDKNFWSVRANRDIRIIVHKSDANFLLCYVDHHDKAYSWAERRKLETHPVTGAAQLVEIRETVREIDVPVYVVVEQKKPKVLSSVSEDTLLQHGVPNEWVQDLKNADEDSLLELVDHLPEEAAEAVLTLAVGGIPSCAVPDRTGDPFEHPDAKRRFHLFTESETLRRALDYPWDQWMVFLHPEQSSIIEKSYNGPARVAGSAGTGKTVVAIHRAVYLARTNPNAKVLLTTFSRRLADLLNQKVEQLADGQTWSRQIFVADMESVVTKLHREKLGNINLVTPSTVKEILGSIVRNSSEPLPKIDFLVSEWHQVVDAWQILNWTEYQTLKRLGRKTRLLESQREKIWNVMLQLRSEIQERGQCTMSDVYTKVAALNEQYFTHVVVDEAQDISVPQLRFASKIVSDSSDSLFFAGDLGQRIFQTPFSWKELGVDIRGRSFTLKVNYRTSHQIRRQADKLLPSKIADVDGTTENRNGTVSAFTGPEPLISIEKNMDSEQRRVTDQLETWIANGVSPEEICLIVRSESQHERAAKAIDALADSTLKDRIKTATMHYAKGLEFRCVIVMACDDLVVPLESRINNVTDEGDLEDVYNTERHLLYVACTRARDELLVTGVEPASEFLDDLIAS